MEPLTLFDNLRPRGMLVKTYAPMLASLLVLAALPLAHAAQPAGLTFSHYDWELTCDNTRTCRAAGYHSEDGSDDAGDADGASLPVSVLLTRKAGPREPVQAEFQIGNPGEGQTTDQWPAMLSMTMRIDGKPVGKLVIHQGKWTVDLAPQQTSLLTSALTRRSRIDWSDGKHTWRLSDKGAAAVLLKMDEFQGRLGTPGALTRKGTRDESTVLPPLPAPVIQAARVPVDDRVRLPDAGAKAIRAALAASGEECMDSGPVAPRAEMSLHRLSSTKLLVSMPCWRAAYNEGAAYWVVNAAPPYAPTFVTANATDYAEGKLQASQKGRGIGDCWSFEEWTWDGKAFVHTAEGTTGACKEIAPGGAWSLPLLVTTVRPAPGSRP